MLRRIQIENFKGIESLSVDLDQANQIIANNGVGKTSFNEALKFLLDGSARDKTLIKEGAELASVYGVWEIDGQKIEVKRILTEKGCSLDFKVDGEGRKGATSSLLKKFFGVASFNPTDVLDAKERSKLFEDMVKDKFVVPEEIINFTEAADMLPELSSLNEDRPIECLNKFRKSLEDYRLMVGREKKNAEAVSNEDSEELKTKNMKFMEIGIDESRLRTKQEVMTDKAKYDALKEEQDDLASKIEHRERILKKERVTNTNLREMTARSDANLANKEKELEDMKSKIKEVDDAPDKLRDELRACEIKEEIDALKKRAMEKHKKSEEKSAEYAKINKYLKEDFNDLYSKYLDDVKKKIKGFDFFDGEYRYDGKRIDDLSQGERLSLAVKMLEAQELDSNVICIDNAECLDEKNAKKLGLSQEGTSYILLKVGEAFPIEANTIDLKESIEKSKDKKELSF